MSVGYIKRTGFTVRTIRIVGFPVGYMVVVQGFRVTLVVFLSLIFGNWFWLTIRRLLVIWCCEGACGIFAECRCF